MQKQLKGLLRVLLVMTPGRNLSFLNRKTTTGKHLLFLWLIWSMKKPGVCVDLASTALQKHLNTFELN